MQAWLRTASTPDRLDIPVRNSFNSLVEWLGDLALRTEKSPMRLSENLNLVLIVTAFACLCGCGEGSAAKPVANSNSPSAAEHLNSSDATHVPSATPGVESPQNSSSPELSQSVTTPDLKDESAQPVAAKNNAAAETKLAPVRQVEKPTAEQIARWTVVEVDPLQLLACRDASAIGVVSIITPLTDGRHYLLAGSKVTLWSVESDAPEHVFLESTGENTIESLAVSSDNSWFVAGDKEGNLRTWSISDRKELKTTKAYSTGVIQTAISPDAKRIATLTYDAEITIWNAEDLQQQSRFKVDTSELKRIEFMTPELLAAAGETTSSWNVNTGKLDRQLSTGRYNFTLARSKDGSRFLFGKEDSLQLWNIANGKPETTFNGGFAQDERVAFSSDGHLIATANQSSIRIWDASTGRPIQYINAFGWPIVGLSWLPDTDLLLVSSISGRTRVWGRAKNGASLSMAPLHESIAPLDSTSREPATPPQLEQTIDLRIFPRFSDGPVIGIDQFSLMYEVSAAASEVQMFYRFQLEKAGWSEVAADAVTPDSLKFRKDGVTLVMSTYASGDQKTQVSVNLAGNYDLRWLPKFDGAPAEVVFENADTVMYRTKADLLQIETALLKSMHAAGWTAFATLNSAHAEDEDRRQLNFLRSGLTVGISIGRDPADAANFFVQYSKSLATRTVPVPLDSGFVEFDGSTTPLLVASTAMTLEQTCQLYDKQLAIEGWLARDIGRSIKENHASLTYIRGQQDLSISLTPLKNGRTQIVIGDDLQNSWQLAKPKEPTTDDSSGAGIEAADFPILNDSRSASVDATAKTIDVSMNEMPLSKVGELYTKELQALGWATEGSGIQSDDYVFLTFVKDKKEIELRARMTNNKSTVNIQGDGLLWTRELNGGKKAISYESWLRANNHHASLDLLDQYFAEMKQLKK